MMVYFIISISIYIATFLTVEAVTTSENGIRRGVYPFMALVYYPDSEILDDMGVRFQRAGILIHESWLITASIDGKETTDVGFPKKTLIARLGAIHLDANFTLNEDEDEQEREIIQVVQSANHKKATWWKTDVNLLKTLLPFNLSQAVSTTTFQARQTAGSKNCLILVYARQTANEDKILMKLDVDLLPSTKDECGENFDETSMMCASQNEENKSSFTENFCQGNRGGPLLCDGDVIGLQTYVDDCKHPFLYQILSRFEGFIQCAMQDQCSETTCSKTCISIYKDEFLSSTKKTATHSVSSYFLDGDTKNTSNTPLPYSRAMEEELTASPTLTPLVEVTTSTPTSISSVYTGQSASTWDSAITENVSMAASSVSEYSSSSSDPTVLDDASSVYSSLDPGSEQNAEAGSDATAEQAQEPLQDIGENSPEPPTDLGESSNSSYREPSTPEESSNFGNYSKPEEEEGHVMKILESRRKSHHREDAKERRGKVEAQLKVPLTAPMPKTAGATRIMSHMSGLILSAMVISFV